MILGAIQTGDGENFCCKGLLKQGQDDHWKLQGTVQDMQKMKTPLSS